MYYVFPFLLFLLFCSALYNMIVHVRVNIHVHCIVPIHINYLYTEQVHDWSIVEHTNEVHVLTVDTAHIGHMQIKYSVYTYVHVHVHKK